MPKAIDPEIRARVLAEIRAGMGIRETARKYQISHKSVIEWRDSDETAVRAVVPPEQQQARIDLAAKVTEYIGEALDTLITHLRLARDPAWFGQQDAAGLATFDGVHHDKLVRTLAAAQRAAAGELERDDGDLIDGEIEPPALA